MLAGQPISAGNSAVGPSYFLKDYLEAGGWERVQEHIEVSLKELLIKQSSLGDSFFIDSLECFI